MNELLAMPREWLAATGEISRFTGNIVRDVWGLRVFRFFGEALRQSGILIISSTLIIWALMFILGLECGIEGAYFTEAQGAPAYSGVFSAWCDLREITPYAFGYMMAAKVGTGIVAELGAMRISDEIDALEVMGIDSMTFLCGTRLLAAWLVLPFMYLAGIGAAFLASYIAVVQQVGAVSSGGYLLIFWQFQHHRTSYTASSRRCSWPPRSCSWAATTATTPAVALSVWAARPPSRWCSTSCSCT